MLAVKLICVGKMREKFYIDAFSEYSKRLGAYCRFECVELAELVTRQALSGRSKLCLVIGGSYGISPSVKKRADIRLSMSKMTFPHHLARVMLAEQIYRAFKINEGSRYHK